MRLWVAIKHFFVGKPAPVEPPLICARCHKRTYSALDRALYAHYTPYCGYDCHEWAEISEKVDNNRIAKELENKNDI